MFGFPCPSVAGLRFVKWSLGRRDHFVAILKFVQIILIGTFETSLPIFKVMIFPRVVWRSYAESFLFWLMHSIQPGMVWLCKLIIL